jgi:hypothetical protein
MVAFARSRPNYCFIAESPYPFRRRTSTMAEPSTNASLQAKLDRLREFSVCDVSTCIRDPEYKSVTHQSQGL